MSGVFEAIEDLVSNVIDAIEDLVKVVWDAVVEPILEQVFAIFGITDETVVTVQRVTSPMYATNTTDVVQAGIARAIFSKIKTDTSFFPNYMREIYKTKGQIRAYYRYGELGLYYAGLPEMLIKGVIANFPAIQAAIEAEEIVVVSEVLSARSRNPSRTDWFRWQLQDSPEFYVGWTNSLTFEDEHGATYSDWLLGEIDYNSGTDDYTINISRTAEEAQFWIQGPSQVTEGDTATFTVKCNRMVPIGSTVNITFSYSGAAVDTFDYNRVASVSMLENTNEITVDIVTLETANANKIFSITIDSIDNTGGIFETVTINAQDTVSCTITDDDTLKLTMNDVIVDEANTTIVIPVKLELAAPSGAFSIGYNFTDLGTTVGGVDYDNTVGTLNFVGTAGETQNISIDIYADVADDDREQFEVYLENSTDLDSIETGDVATVTIIDGTLDPAPVDIEVAATITKPSYVKEPSIVAVYETGTPGEFYYWVHPHSDVTYSLLPTATTLSGLEMLPMAILRKEKTQLGTLYGEGSEQYITTRMLMARAGLKLEEFLEAIGSNPSIDDVDDAYINYAMSPLDTNKVVSKMLYLSWYQIVVTSGLSSNVGEYSATISEGDIQNAVVWSQHTETTDIVGVVADEGDYTHFITDTNLTCQWQKTATTYDEIVINNLNGVTAINYQTYHEVALCKLGDDEFTIPVSWDIFSKVTAKEQMEVYQYLARVDVNAINITELEWYETEAFFELFEFVMIIVSIVIIVFSFGTGTPFVTGLLAAVEQLVINYAIGELMIFIAEETGNEVLAAIVGVVAAIYANDPSMLSTDMLLTADTLIDLSTEFAGNLKYLEDLENMSIAEDLMEANAEAKEKIEAELANREDVKAVSIDAQFLASIESVDTSNFPAIQGNYAYDSLYNYDSLVGNYHNQQLEQSK